MKNYFKISSLLIVLVLVFNSCAELEIENPNEPNFDDVVASPEDIFNIPGGAFVAWHQAQSTVNTGTAWATNADVLTCSWGNFGIRNFSWEPPIAIDNSLTSNDAPAIATAYSLYYAANSTGIDLERFADNPDNQPIIVQNEDVTDMIRAVGKLLIGASHGYISILYNQGFNADATVNLADLNGDTYVSYQEMATFAVAKLEEAAAIADGADFTLPDTYINGLTYTSDEFAALCRTIAAQVLTYNPRTPDEVGSVDWAKVATLTAGGIQADHAPLGDDNLWFDDFKLLGGGSLVNGSIAVTWARVDNKLVNLMDPSYPTAYPASGTIGTATSSDLRLASDFGYNATVYFPEDRGRYRFSEYYHNRYAVNTTSWNGVPMVKIMKAENDLMRAEALIRSGGNKQTAADLINLTRVGRGGLAPVSGTDSDAVLLQAVFYERMIELLNTWGGRELAEARRWSGWLREGAFRQLPVPASELSLLGVELYTFGGLESTQ